MNQTAVQKEVKDPSYLAGVAKNIRRSIVDLIFHAKSSHIGCSLSATDILATLYFEVMNVDPKRPEDPDRDRFVLSKGHSVTALYSTLAEKGFFPKEALKSYGADGTPLASHANLKVLPGMENTAGSGGHGLSLGVGMAVAMRTDGRKNRIFVLSGDGELEEGSVWEALLFAGHHKLSNLTFIIDRNHFQDGADGQRTENILDIDPLDEKLRAFHLDVTTVDGHDYAALKEALTKASDKPRAVIAMTIKGKGVSFMEGKGEWHGKCPDEAQYAQAMKELS